MKTAAKTAFDPKAYLKLKCPLCDSELERRKIAGASTWFLTAMGVLLAPLLIGIYLIHRALKGRREVYLCPSCGRGG